MKQIISKQHASLKPRRVQVQCAFCGEKTWWEKRPELIYRGSHRYARWCCSRCGRTSERAKHHGEALATTLKAMRDGPGSPAWKAYEQLDTYA